MEAMGRMLLWAGGVLVLLGLLLTYGSKLFSLGRLPGDIVIQRGNFTFYFPLVTSLLISAALSLVVYLVHLWRRP